MAKFQSLRKPLLSQEVEKQLHQSIIDGIFNSGEKLPTERELTEQFQVSRMTIREALKSLKKSGLIEVRRGMNAGAYVREQSPEPITESFQNLIQMGRVNFHDLIEARLYLEPSTAKSVALRGDPKGVETLEKLLDNAEKMLKTSCKKARLLNVSFHCEVARISSNQIVSFITESVTQVFSEFLIESTKEDLSKNEIMLLIEQHREILEAIQNKDGDRAYQKTKSHLEKVQLMYRRVT